MNIKKSRFQTLSALAITGLMAGLSACNDDPERNFTADQAAEFKDSCIEAGGTVKEVSCNGQTTCAGTFLDGESGTVIETACKGTNDCAGIQCIEPDAMSSSSSPVETSSSSSTAASGLLAAKTVDEFEAACEAAGKTAEVQAICAGHNTCAGVYFDEAKSSAYEATCEGHSTCKGLKCPA